MACGGDLPPDFDIVGVCQDSRQLLEEIDCDIREHFDVPRRRGSSKVRHSESYNSDVDRNELSDCDIDSDDEDNSHDILSSPVIQSRIRDFVRHNSINDEESDVEDPVNESSGHVCSDLTLSDSCADLLPELERRKEKCSQGCLSNFTAHEIFDHRLNIVEISKEQRDLFIMGQLQACGTSRGNETRDGVRKRHRFDYQFSNCSVCRDCFLFLNNISDVCLKNIRKHMYKEGVVPRVHGNARKSPAHAATFDDTKRVVHFITRYAEEYGLPQPAAPRGRDDIPPVYLPGKDTYKSVHQRYQDSCDVNERRLSETTFRRIWHRVVPHVKFMTPRTDVCHKCEQYRDLIQKARTENDKLSATEAFMEHILGAQKERDHYRKVCVAAKEELDDHPRSADPQAPCSNQLKHVHYTFDLAQSVLLPSHCRQEGALYFLSPYKVNLFGICNDGRTFQHNYVFGESECIGTDGEHGHSANSVVSMLHDFFEKHGDGEEVCYLNADNCGGQNKNYIVTSYLAWRVSNNLHREIHLHFMKPYHARCLVDGLFGLARRAIRRSDCDSMQEIKVTVERSSEPNLVVLYGNDDGAWQWRDWKSFFKPIFRAVPGIQTYHHFKFSCEKPGEVSVKKSVDSPETTIRLLKRSKSIPTERPCSLQPGGTSSERAKYLHKRIRPFVKDPWKDVLCPSPMIEE